MFCCLFQDKESGKKKGRNKEGTYSLVSGIQSTFNLEGSYLRLADDFNRIKNLTKAQVMNPPRNEGSFGKRISFVIGYCDAEQCRTVLGRNPLFKKKSFFFKPI